MPKNSVTCHRYARTDIIPDCARYLSSGRHRMPIPKPRRTKGSHLYRYSRPRLEWLRTIILEHELYLPSLRELNDPADGLPKLAVQSEDQMSSFLYDRLVERNPSLSPDAKKEKAKIIRFNVRMHGPGALHPNLVKAMDTQLQDFRILSLTKRFDKMNLWALYADQHRGYCLEFANDGPLFEHAKEVSYVDPAQMEILITDPAIASGDFLFCKSLDWANEEEVRLVLPRGKGSKVRFDPRWLTRLILGKDMSEANGRSIREWAEQRTPHLTVVSAYFDPISRSIKLRD